MRTPATSRAAGSAGATATGADAGPGPGAGAGAATGADLVPGPLGGDPAAWLTLAALAVAAGLVAVLVRWLANRRLASDVDRATFATLHAAALAAESLRGGLTRETAGPAARHLRALLGTPAVALVDTERLLVWDGAGASHGALALAQARTTLASGRTEVLGIPDCGDHRCPVRQAVCAAVAVDGAVVGALLAYPAGRPSSLLVRATEAVAGWVASQVSLADLDVHRTRAAEAELRALRAQISPHFVYNALAAIASFVRTDPARARELLLEFADLTRYSFQHIGEFTTLADELRNVERYLSLEQARFGDRLVVELRIAPEVLGVTVPFLCVQPLVENAVRHGLEGADGAVRVRVEAVDDVDGAVLVVEDDGVGAHPAVVQAALDGTTTSDSVGLGNVDERLRQVFGDTAGLVAETAPGAGTRVSFRVPKFSAGVRAG